MSIFNSGELKSESTQLITTFVVGKEMFGLDVMLVQEVTGNQNIVPVPLAPNFVRGLINLRGQLATAFGLAELFGASGGEPTNQMSVVCRLEGNLVSLIVDSIGDVIEADNRNFDATPDTVAANIKPYVKGIYKMNGSLISMLDLEKLGHALRPTAEAV